jgi:beta-lactamase superfamily II metal-dependent hydrolase
MRGQRLLSGTGYTVNCLWPPRGFRADPRWTPNRESAVLLVELAGARDTLRILLMGDADTLVERALLEGGLPPCALLKIGHHGSRTSSGEALLDAVRPRVALVSVGRVNRFGHPHPDVRARFARRGIAWRSTSEEGALDVVAGRDASGEWRVSIDPAREARPIALARRRGAG